MELINRSERYADIITKVVVALAMVAVFVICVAGIDSAIDRKAVLTNQFTPSEVTADMRTRDLDCLTKNIYWEAAGEPFEGKVAVAQVTLNRAGNSAFPSDICGVVYQKTSFQSKVVCQFSWFCERNHLVRPVHRAEYEEAAIVARKVLLENFRLDALTDALYYHADYVNPRWGKQKVAKIGRHIFYRG